MATPERALLDYVYASRVTWDGVTPLLEDLRIELSTVRNSSLEELGNLVGAFQKPRITQFVNDLKRDLQK